MNWFKRLCLFVFGVSGILALVALCLTWVGPWTTQARSMLELRWYFTTLEVLVCVSGAGLLICALVALFAPRNPKETVVAKVDGGEITVTRAAIVSQARHVIEADGTCVASSVKVRMRKRGHVRVNARVTPRRPVDLIQRGTSLYAELEEGLSHICGDSVKSIDVVFNEPEQQGPMRTYSEADEAPAASESAASEPVVAAQDISVPVASLTAHEDAEPAAAVADPEAAVPEPEATQAPADDTAELPPVPETGQVEADIAEADPAAEEEVRDHDQD